jgi:hypothetical protein
MIITLLQKRLETETKKITHKTTLKRNLIAHQYNSKNKSSIQLSQTISRNLGTNKPENLPTLRGRCRLLVKDPKHRKMIVKSLKNGALCPNWQMELSGLVKD